jgi:flagellar hook-length control protein FliK
MTEIASFFAPAAAPAQGANAVAPSRNAGDTSVFASLLAQLQDGGTQGAPATAQGNGILQQLETLLAPKAQASSKITAQLSASALLDEAASATQNTDAAAQLAGQNALATALNTTQLPALLQAQITAQSGSTTANSPVPNATDATTAGKPGLTADQLAQLQLLNGDGANAASADPKFAQLLAGAIAAHGQMKSAAQVNAPATKQAGASDGAVNGTTAPNPNGVPQAAALEDKSAVAPATNSGNPQNQQQALNQSLDFGKALDTSLAGQPGYVPVQPGFAAELLQAQSAQSAGGLQTAVPLDALAVQIARKFDEGSSQFEISLHPAELGKLDISLNVSQDGRVHAVLRAERAETLDLLRQDARSLETQLRQAGLDVGSNALSFQLSQGGNQRQQTTASDFAKSFSQDETSATADIVNTAYVAVRKRDGLDIHV